MWKTRKNRRFIRFLLHLNLQKKSRYDPAFFKRFLNLENAL